MLLNNNNMKKNNQNTIYLVLSYLAIVLSICYFGYNLIFNVSAANQLFMTINSGLVMILTFLITIDMLINKEEIKKLTSTFTILILGLFILLNLLQTNNVVIVPSKKTMLDFTNTNVDEAIKWATENNVIVEQKYEYSDIVPQYGIISQDTKADTLLSDIKTITFIVSAGPNYDKEIILGNLVGLTIDEALNTINNNHLNNVEINYQTNNDVDKDVIISQSIKGKMRRSDKLMLTISLGNKENITETKMIDLKNKNLFEATLWLKRNDIEYTLSYEFSDLVKRNCVTAQSVKEGLKVNPSIDKVKLFISKGKKIIVPDLSKMTSDEITTWIINNNLNVNYADKYDTTIPIGNIISVNYKMGDEIEEGTTISIVISKGQLKMKSFTSLNDFRDWASQYNIKYEEEYEFNSVTKGQIIRFSQDANEVISPNDIITVYISNGLPVTIPNFIGKTKSSIITTCNSLGLNCTFTYSDYSSSAKDVALSQNKTVGSQVISGTYVNIGLSKGVAKTFTVYITESQLTIGNPDETINTLKSWFASQYPDVTFIFYKKPSAVYNNGGFIHESSPVKDGKKVTQGNSYQIWITSN